MQVETLKLEDPPRSESSMVASTRTGLISQTVGRPITSSNKEGPSSRASAAGGASKNGVRSSTRTRTSRTGPRIIHSGTSAHSSDPTSSKFLETTQGIADARVVKEMRKGKKAVLRQVVKAGEVVLGFCTMQVSDTPSIRTICVRTVKKLSGGRLEASSPVSTSAGAKRSRGSDELIELEEV